MLEIKDKNEVPLVAPDPKVPQGFFRRKAYIFAPSLCFDGRALALSSCRGGPTK